ncbi:ABC transporter substrate-binding protein [Streptomyces flaveus]|uniref:ABC transporter substrate-binding protein n=1 Tax=Streptomyces flaveus TaxID=66370 RepID=UPI001FEC4C28|nr:ABC transporter substrate-binding protein [Streptomyces flaveus]
MGVRSPVHRTAVSRHQGRQGFTAAYRERHGTPPGRWAAEAYDAVGLIARALTAAGTDTGIDPGEVAEHLFSTGYDGLAKPIRFAQDNTHALKPDRTRFLYQVRDGTFRFLGRHDQVQGSNTDEKGGSPFEGAYRRERPATSDASAARDDTPVLR